MRWFSIMHNVLRAQKLNLGQISTLKIHKWIIGAENRSVLSNVYSFV